jgi:hypothetical protein
MTEKRSKEHMVSKILRLDDSGEIEEVKRDKEDHQLPTGMNVVNRIVNLTAVFTHQEREKIIMSELPLIITRKLFKFTILLLILRTNRLQLRKS